MDVYVCVCMRVHSSMPVYVRIISWSQYETCYFFPISLCKFVCILLYICWYGNVHVCMHAGVCICKGRKLISNVLSDYFPSYFLSEGHSLKLL